MPTHIDRVDAKGPLHGGGNILIVDDNPQNLRLLITILSAEGHKVRPAPSGAIALESAFSTVPDLVLLDIMMPEMDGYAVCQQLKAHEETQSVPILFISALDNIDEKLKAFEMGGVDYITKPFQPKEIIARINTHLSLRNVQKRLEHEVAMRTASEKMLHELTQKYDLILSAAAEGILGIDKQCAYSFVNPAAAAMLGYEPSELTGSACAAIWHPEYEKRLPFFDDPTATVDMKPIPDCLTKGCSCSDCPVHSSLKQGDVVRQKEGRLWRKDGSSFDAEFVSSPIMVEGKVEGAVMVFSDITERKRMEKKLKQLAHEDALTGVSNRRAFLERAEEEINRTKRYGHPAAFLMMDIDHFKRINDSYGHHAGDEVLKSVSRVCLDALRINDLFGRIGGEEFAALLPETSNEQAKLAADRIRIAIETASCPVDGETILCTMSIGIAMVQPQNEKSTRLEELMKAADDALYTAKSDGRNCVRVAST